MEVSSGTAECRTLDVDQVETEQLRRLPDGVTEATTDCAEGSYVYFLMHDQECVYVGQTVNLQNRLRAHSDKQFDRVLFIHVDDDIRLSAEKEWIATLQPKYNLRLGRPKLTVTRGKRLPVRFSHKEIEQIKSFATSDGLSLSSWVRKRLGLAGTGYGELP